MLWLHGRLLTVIRRCAGAISGTPITFCSSQCISGEIRHPSHQTKGTLVCVYLSLYHTPALLQTAAVLLQIQYRPCRRSLHVPSIAEDGEWRSTYTLDCCTLSIRFLCNYLRAFALNEKGPVFRVPFQVNPYSILQNIIIRAWLCLICHVLWAHCSNLLYLHRSCKHSMSKCVFLLFLKIPNLYLIDWLILLLAWWTQIGNLMDS